MALDVRPAEELGRRCVLPQEVRNLLALNSLQACWTTINPNSYYPIMGFRIYHNMQPMRFSSKYVCLKAEDAYVLANWIDAVQRWELEYGTRL